MTAYYNEFDPPAAQWLENLMEEGLIAKGHIDTRSIKDVTPDDLNGYDQVHLFAGIGGWPAALRLAGWPDDRKIWTASCPCQPFSVAGKGAGTDDPRHLWPDVLRLLRAARPDVLVGEQVAGKAGYDWFDGVSADLDREGYTSRAVDIPACAVDAPLQRNRLYWCAVADADSRGRRGRAQDAQRGAVERTATERPDGTMGNPIGARLEGHGGHGHNSGRQVTPGPIAAPDGSFWSGAEWIICHDGKARRVADASAPLLAHGVSGHLAIPRPGHPQEARQVSRIGAWKGFGNAIVPPLAAEVIGALMDATAEQ